MIRLREDEAESIVAFVKMHERDEIPDDVWDACMRIFDQLYGTWEEEE